MSCLRSKKILPDLPPITSLPPMKDLMLSFISIGWLSSQLSEATPHSIKLNYSLFGDELYHAGHHPRIWPPQVKTLVIR